jgi:plasmid maintenance system antidote protein VapI
MKLDEYLKSMCITKSGFARKVGTTPVHLGNLIKRKCCPGIDLAYKIEKASEGKVTLYDWVDE